MTIPDRKLSIPQIGESLKSLKQAKLLDADDDELWTLAHALNDIQESIFVISIDRLPALLSSALQMEDRKQALMDICEELRHIQYHINDSQILKDYVE